MSILTIEKSDQNSFRIINNQNPENNIFFFVKDGKFILKTPLKSTFRSSDPNSLDDIWDYEFGEHLGIHNMLDNIYQHLFSNYKANFKKEFSEKQKKAINKKIILGFKKRFAGRITEQIKQLQKLVDPNIIRLEKIAFLALGPKGYKDLSPYILKTINEYQYKNDLEKPAFWVARLIHKDEYDHRYGEKKDLTKWMNIFLPDNKNKFIHNFLSNYKGGLGMRWLQFTKHLSAVTRPIEGNTHFKLLSQLIGQYLADLSVEKSYEVTMPVINSSSYKDYISARDILAKHLRRKVKFNTKDGIYLFANYIGDYMSAEQQIHNGNIVGLMEKAIHWHREEASKAGERYLKQYGNANTKIPEVGLPTISGIEFLDTCQKIYEEGQIMNHCVGSYIGQAMNGQSYIFHVEKFGEHATLQIRKDGDKLELGQCHGPHNRDNKASKWAKKEMNKWLVKVNPKKSEKTVDNDVPF